MGGRSARRITAFAAVLVGTFGALGAVAAPLDPIQAAAQPAGTEDVVSRLPVIEPAPVVIEPPAVPPEPAPAAAEPAPASPVETEAAIQSAPSVTTAAAQPPASETSAADPLNTSAIAGNAPAKTSLETGSAPADAAPVAAGEPQAGPAPPNVAGEEAPAKLASMPAVEPPAAAPEVRPPAVEADTIARPDPATAGGAPYGPDLPNAALAAAIARDLAGAKGALEQAIASFYADRAFQPVWLDGEALDASARSALRTLGSAAEDGLQAAPYAVPVDFTDIQTKVRTEVALTRAMLRYARDARGARINPGQISRLITAEPTIPPAAEILTILAAAPDAGAALADFQPHQQGYRALKQELARMRATAPEADRPEAKKAAREEDEIVANMERWRWLPRDLGETYILVNVPEFRLRVVREGVVVHEAKVIVGKPKTPTPIFSHPMEYLIVNPYWNIPPSIALKEMLPKLREDPHALERQGYEVVRGGRVVDPATVDWSGGLKNLRLRQPPGERNALGYIKFMFPNDHSVYIHDTPSRSLFASATRAFSHGCVRVQEPFSLAQILLADQSGVSAEQLRRLIGKGERTIHLTSRVPVHIAYFTAFVDDAGRLETRPDIYGHSAKVRAALGLTH